LIGEDVIRLKICGWLFYLMNFPGEYF
jgi:hypothetical protein